MPEYRKFIVEPSLPEKLKPLEEIANNLWWTWNPDAINLLRRIDPDMWEEFNHNPVRVLGTVSQARLKELEDDEGFLTHTERVYLQLTDYLNSETWFSETHGKNWPKGYNMAYFSLEFGIDECLPIYSGGLGVLAGDHLKSASDLGVPLVAVGLAYTHGYFFQYLNTDGWQQEVYPDNNFHLLPLRLKRDENNDPIKIAIPFPGRTVYAQLWEAEVGRVPLILLDTHISENTREDQELTSQLYGGDWEMRIKQEILIGVGGVRALEALGHKTAVYHMNEGHSAFLAVERILHFMREHGLDFLEAKEANIASSVFTTHTPVPAGNDRFEKGLVEKYLTPLIGDTPGVDLPRLISLGRINPEDQQELFCMTVFALRLSSASNGVSKLHGKVSRRMWQEIWQDLPADLVPIGSITNGIHIRTWISEELRNLFERYLGVGWINRPGDDSIWQQIDKIPDAELWRMHERRRDRLVGFARKRIHDQIARRGGSESEMKQAEEVLDPDALTIGFARRFASYKRGTLIFRDLERLFRILNDKERPVQILFAGKAHPRDVEGKNLIKEIIHTARKEGFLRRVVFLENYDIDVARYLVQGCDIWLNNPRRPLEASGTSGMKAAANGIMNLSILDGWWDEGYSPDVGWAIGRGEKYEEPAMQDAIESRNLYDVLEQDIIPLYYNRGTDGFPREWIQKMKSSMKKLIPVFNTNRMVREYAEQFYIPLGQRLEEYVHKKPAIIKDLAAWKHSLKSQWYAIQVLEVTENGQEKNIRVGENKAIEATIHLGELKPDDLLVECYYGTLNNDGNIEDGHAVPLESATEADNGNYIYKGEIPCYSAGLQGYAIRILPQHPNLVSRFIPGLITWG